MLFPQNNHDRKFTDLSGLWKFRFGPGDDGWGSGFEDDRPIAVPASWNEQFEEGRDHLGPAWYQTKFNLPWGYQGQKIFLRFGSVNYLADVWLNGEKIGTHEGGHLPFEFDVTGFVRGDANTLVVRVDGNLAFDRVPPGNTVGGVEDVFANHIQNYPPTFFDFFPYCGIHRPVYLYAVPQNGIRDVTVVTEIEGTSGQVSIMVETYEDADLEVRAILAGYGQNIQTATTLNASGGLHISVPGAKLWAPEHPHLYNLTIRLEKDGQILDSYTLRVGIRTFKVDGDQFLLNGEPIQLIGFGRHEDFPISGRGYNPAVMIKDYALMDWVGANSFRTTHYPYSEQMMDLADELGFLVIDETPAVGLFFREDGLARRLDLCQQMTREIISRDKNHPSVIAWSLANEPHSTRPEAVPFFRTLYDLAKELDPTRPTTLVSHVGLGEDSFAFLDFICLNRYHGWYMNGGKIEEGVTLLSGELDMIHEKFKKPIVLSEFGADTLPGWHAQPPEMFSEEYQAEFLRRYIETLNSKPFVVGQHVWNLCDFKTSQGVTRVGGINYKGVFTRDRRPKMAAHLLRDLWKNSSN